MIGYAFYQHDFIMANQFFNSNKECLPLSLREQKVDLQPLNNQIKSLNFVAKKALQKKPR